MADKSTRWTAARAAPGRPSSSALLTMCTTSACIQAAGSARRRANHRRVAGAPLPCVRMFRPLRGWEQELMPGKTGGTLQTLLTHSADACRPHAASRVRHGGDAGGRRMVSTHTASVPTQSDGHLGFRHSHSSACVSRLQTTFVLLRRFQRSAQRCGCGRRSARQRRPRRQRRHRG